MLDKEILRNPTGAAQGFLFYVRKESGGAGKAADADICAVCFCGVQQSLEGFGMNKIIAVHEEQPLAIAVGEGPVDAGVPGGGKSPVFLMNYDDSGIFFGVFFTNLAASVRTAVVYQNQLKVLKGLSEDAVYAPVQVLFDLKYWNDYAYPCIELFDIIYAFRSL